MLTMDSETDLPKFDKQYETHSAKVLHTMNQHRKEHTKLCDVTLEVNNKQFPVHKSILSSCSPYFLAMFSSDMKESKQHLVVLKDVDDQILEKIIDFIYTGSIDINSTNVEDILKVSTQFQFREVRDIACNFLEKQLEPLNCVGIRKFAMAHNCQDFCSIIDAFVIKHFMEVLSSEEFVQIPFEGLKAILSSNHLKVDSEIRVYNGIMKWIKHDLNERKARLCDLLRLTRLPLLSTHFLTGTVDAEPLIKNSFQARDLLDEAKNYHLQPENHAVLRTLRTLPRFSTCGLLFAAGGKESGEIITDKAEYFSIYDNEWKEIAPMLQPRQQHGVCELGKKIFAIAGSDGTNRTDSVEMYSLETNTWEKGQPLQTCRSGVSVSVLGNAIYACGGYDGRVCINSVERFDPTKQTWEYVASTNLARSFPGMVRLGQRLYVIGGNDGTAFLDSCECYDPLTNKWTFISAMNVTRAGIGCAELDGILYVAGGYDGLKRSNVVEMYDPRMNVWREVCPMVYARDGCSMASFGGYLFAIGGIDGPSYLNTVEYYEPITDTWNPMIPMETSRAAAGVAILPADDFVEV